MPDNTTNTNKIPVACFAPELSDSKLESYKELIEDHEDREVKDMLSGMLSCVSQWWELPESKQEGRKWVLNRTDGDEAHFMEVPLEKEHIKELWEVTPYMRELNTYSNPEGTGPLDKLPNGELRDCAFTLLWYCKEITLDREPISQDKVTKVKKTKLDSDHSTKVETKKTSKRKTK